jgi:hypothetical protein
VHLQSPDVAQVYHALPGAMREEARVAMIRARATWCRISFPRFAEQRGRVLEDAVGERFEASGGSDGLKRSSAAGHILTASV